MWILCNALIPDQCLLALFYLLPLKNDFCHPDISTNKFVQLLLHKQMREMTKGTKQTEFFMVFKLKYKKL